MSYIVVAVVFLVLAGYLVWRRQVVARRKAHPKDFAFQVSRGFGPEMRLPKIERLKKHLPWVPEAELASWLPEFENVDSLLGRLSEQGGTKVLGRPAVEKTIQDQFPFLSHGGLSASHLLGWLRSHARRL